MMHLLLSRVVAGLITVLLSAHSFLTPAAAEVEYRSLPGRGSQVLIEGTSTLHDWRVESRIIGGGLRLDSSAFFDPARAKPGLVRAQLEVFVPVRSLKSMKNGRPYSVRMDNIMYDLLRETEHKRILYRLKALVVSTNSIPASDGLTLSARGELTVAGAVREVTMPIRVEKPAADRLKFSGSVSVKMTDFGIQPPNPLPAIKTGDEVKLSFEWIAARRKTR